MNLIGQCQADGPHHREDHRRHDLKSELGNKANNLLVHYAVAFTYPRCKIRMREQPRYRHSHCAIEGTKQFGELLLFNKANRVNK